jgi:uncharacterized membrane protein
MKLLIIFLRRCSMLSIISSFITAILNYDKIDNGEDVIHDSEYGLQIIGTTFILEVLVGIIVFIKTKIKKA